MADALCGPSNALQNFKSHVQSDRSLQQDRYVGPRTGAQSFRTHDPRAGSLDADFAAFENAQANPFLEPAFNGDFRALSHVQQPLSPAGWASDFQNLHISDQPLPAQQFRAHAPLIKSMNGGWQNEFMRQQNGHTSPVTKGKQNAFDQQNMPSYAPQMQYTGAYGAMSSFNPQTAAVHQIDSDVHVQENTQLEGADWSQAFEDAFQDAFQEAEQQFDQKHETTTQDMQNLNRLNEPLAEMQQQQTESIRIGSDAIEYTETKDQTAAQDQQDANALARVAGELLHNVQHDNSSKFQNSQFLDLMRKIRDRQVEVRNNDFEDTQGTAASSSGALQDDHPIQSQLRQDHLNNYNNNSNSQPETPFAFPDMNPVYSSTDPSDYVDYSFDSDQFPTTSGTINPYHGQENQISHLHPGGRMYPEQSPPPMSSSSPVVGKPISAADFDEAGGFEENRSFARRFMR